MPIENKPFVRMHEEKKSDHVTLKMNLEERADLERLKKLIRQPKDSTAIKQLMRIGAKVVQSKQTQEIIEILFNNTRKNKRLGITEFE